MSVILHNVLHGKFCRQFENKDTTLQMEEVPDLSYELCYYVDIAVSNILTEPGSLLQ